MPKVTEAYLEKRRQQIVDAAVTCFARKGFHQTTMEDIGREAGLSPGLPYRYFSSKEEIIHATIEESRSRVPLIPEQVKGQAGFFDFVDAVIRYVCTGLEANGADIRWKVRLQAFALAARQANEAQLLRQVRGDALDMYEHYIQVGQRSGHINPSLDARAIGHVLLAFIDGLAVQWTADPEMDIWQAAEVVMALFSGTFRPVQTNSNQ